MNRIMSSLCLPMEGGHRDWKEEVERVAEVV